ncbi:Mn-dependent transcriptional regulator [Sporocytophaga myxococcoides]|uniref:Transcriptional regulator MntR n=1 Tax=Sporocytophaga myxococcoides TaxID=153721 RepID=A0A098LK28_9BACT|nr:metal-dependent transcriptional regulator [Sporocytophaga myxococcoides]GAL86809.1 Mn-dependent transcriptional regulator [Sporocytophaga myxococcoides]
MLLSYTEENYLKAIYHLSEDGKFDVSTNAISDALNTKPASVSDMLKKLSQKEVINYIKYQGVSLTPSGLKIALQIIRKHRLWEVFLVEKLNFNWDEVHEIAEQLEHIQSNLLIERLDEFLGFPPFDPHGDPIPNGRGEMKAKKHTPLSETDLHNQGKVIGLKETSPLFLQYLDKAGIYIGAKIKVMDKIEFDGSLEILIDNKKTILVSNEVAKNILIAES